MEFFLDCRNGITGYSVLAQLKKAAKRKILVKKYKEKIRVRTLLEIKKIIQRTNFTKFVLHGNSGRISIKKTRFTPYAKRKAMQFFWLLAKAEAKVHRSTPRKVHLHEVARKENIFRILAIFSLIRKLKIKKFVCTPINVGSGKVKTAHGILQVPTPATRELLKGLPTLKKKGTGELTTPTGACFARMLCRKFSNTKII